jgi:hypothetical protein
MIFDSIGVDEAGESMRGQPGFFDVAERLQRLTDLGRSIVGFALFLKVISSARVRESSRVLPIMEASRASVRGRPPCSPFLANSPHAPAWTC